MIDSFDKGPMFWRATPLMTLEDVKREHIIAMVEYFNGDKSKACRALGITQKTLYTRLHEYGLFEKYRRQPWGRELESKPNDGDDRSLRSDAEVLGAEPTLGEGQSGSRDPT